MKWKEILTAKQFLIEIWQYQKFEIWRKLIWLNYRKDWYAKKTNNN